MTAPELIECMNAACARLKSGQLPTLRVLSNSITLICGTKTAPVRFFGKSMAEWEKPEFDKIIHNMREALEKECTPT